MAQTQAVHEYVGGEIVEFVAYGEEMGDPLLQPGERCKVEGMNDDGGLVVAVIDDKGKLVKGRQKDTVFPEEVKLVAVAETPAEPEAATEAEETDKAPAKSTRKKGGKGSANKSAKKTTGDTQEAKPAAAKKGGKGSANKPAKSSTPAASATVEAEETAEAKAEVKTVDRIKHNAEVSAMIEADGALKAAKALVLKAEEAWFDLGGLLLEIQDRDLYVKAGYDEGPQGFHAYVEHELGVEYRKARYLMGIYEVFRDPRIVKKLTKTKFQRLGWSKAKEMARLGADQLSEHFDDLYDKAVEGSREDLVDHIKSTYVVATREGSQRVQKVAFNFSLVGDAANTVQRALAEAQKAVGEEDLNKAFEYLCGDWLATAEGVERITAFEDLDALIAHAEERFGAVLTQVDSE